MIHIQVIEYTIFVTKNAQTICNKIQHDQAVMRGQILFYPIATSRGVMRRGMNSSINFTHQQ